MPSDTGLATRLSIADVARECRLARGYPAKAFRRTTEMSPRQFLSDLCVQEAKSLSSLLDLASAGLAIICRFGDQSYFTRVFSRSCRHEPRRMEACDGAKYGCALVVGVIRDDLA